MYLILSTILCNRHTCTQNDIFSLGVNFFLELIAHPHNNWVRTITRMNFIMFQYKLLIIPSNQHSNKSIIVAIGRQNVGKHGRRLGTGYHPCILHLETGKSVPNNSLAAVAAHNIRLLLNKLYRIHVNSANDKTVNPFNSRLMPLRRSKSKHLCNYLEQNCFCVCSNSLASECILGQLSNNIFDSGIGTVCYVHSLIRLSDIIISTKDIDDQCQDILAKDETLTPKQSHLNQLHCNVLQLMISLYGKYHSKCSSNASDLKDANPFNDDWSNLLKEISSTTSKHDDNSTWDPGDDKYKKSTNSSFEDDN